MRLSFIQTFNRINSHTKDIFALRDACLQSQEVQLIAGQDDFYVRKREGWETWVLKEEDRDPSTRREAGVFSNQYNSTSTPPGEMSADAQPFYPGAPQMHAYFPQPVDHQQYAMQGQTNLSPNVAEFSPQGTPQTNGTDKNTQIVQFHPEEIADDSIATLMVVSKKSVGGSSPSSPGQQLNGVSNITERLQEAVITNGDGPGHNEKSVKPNKQGKTVTDIGWFSAPKSGYTVEEGVVHRSYSEVRALVDLQRSGSGPQRSSDLNTLYKFWSHLLVDSFNSSMYNDFKRLALEDADNGDRHGIDELFKFYGRSFRQRNTVGYNIIGEFMSLVRADTKHGQKLGLDKIRNILTSPVTSVNIKSAIDQLIDPEMRNYLQTDFVELHPACDTYVV